MIKGCFHFPKLMISTRTITPIVHVGSVYCTQHKLKLQRLQNKPQLHSPSPSLALKCGSHLKTFLHGLLQGSERKERQREGKALGRGLIYLNNLVVMKASRVCWRWMDKESGENSGEERVNGVKSNCRQIAGLHNGLNRPLQGS